MSSAQSKTIIIDEPNGFLDPGAVRKLIDIMKADNLHQYIFTTHSAEVIGAVEDASMHLVRWEDGKSVGKTVSCEETKSLREILEELDVRLSDVFGADAIIWVEGATEAKCFPKILHWKGEDVPRGVKFIPVTSAAEMAKPTNKAKALVDIYEAISTSNAIIPPAIAISLDREQHDDAQVNALEAKLGNKVHFLNRMVMC